MFSFHQCRSGAAIYDATLGGPETISLTMTPVLIVYSSLFARWAFIVKPQNLLLASCHMTNVVAQGNQLRRALEYSCGSHNSCHSLQRKCWCRFFDCGRRRWSLYCSFLGTHVQVVVRLFERCLCGGLIQMMHDLTSFFGYYYLVLTTGSREHPLWTCTDRRTRLVSRSTRL
jgi:hypothetical protein